MCLVREKQSTPAHPHEAQPDEKTGRRRERVKGRAPGNWLLLLALVLAPLGLNACSSSSSSRAGDLLTDFDRQLIVQATQDSLEFNKVGESTLWENETNGRVGSATPTATRDEDSDRPCRDFRQTVGIEGTTTTAYDTACRNGDGTWASINYGSLTGALSGLWLGTDGPTYARAYPEPYPYYPRTRYGYWGPYYGYGYPYGWRGGWRYGYGYGW